MRVLAARFADRGAAATLLDQLKERYGLGSEDAAVAPLGETEGQREPGVLLAGRFDDALVAEIRRLFEERGGSLVTDVEEAITRPRRPTGRRHHAGSATPRKSHERRGILSP